MSISKRLLSVILTVCMIVAMVPAVAVSAAGTPVSFAPVTVDEGVTEVTVTFVADGDFEEDDEYTITYDTSVFTYSDAECVDDGVVELSRGTKKQGYPVLVDFYEDGSFADETVGTVTFEIAEGAETGTYEFVDDDDNVVGTITIAAIPYVDFTVAFLSDKTEVKPGDTFTVTFKAYNIPEDGLQAYQLSTLFNTDVFAVTEGTTPEKIAGEIAYGFVDTTTGTFGATLTPPAEYTGKNLVLGTMTFEVLEGAVNGEYTIDETITAGTTWSCDGELAPEPLESPAIAPAVITVTGGSDPVTECQHETKVIIPGYPATCTEAGLTDGEKCAVCEEILVPQEVIPATGHTPVAVPDVPATCTEDGLADVMKCSVCGEITSPGRVVSALGHVTEIIPGYPATCTEDGLTDGAKCVVCGETVVSQEVIPATGHTPVVVDEIPATCTEDGNTGYTYCSVCLEILEGENTVIPAPGHVVVEVSRIEPTCTEFGHTAYTYCSVCNEILEGVNEVIPPTGHTYDEGVVTTDPTCTEPGVITYTCECGDSYTEEILALGHVPVVVEEVPATCTVDGATAYTYCSVCLEVLEGKSSVIPALGHDYVAVVTPPTAEEGGYTTYSCSRCEDSYVSDYTDPTGHHYGPGEVTVEPGCTDTGVMTYTCTDEGCGKSYTEVIDALGHAPVEVPAIAETCTVDGHTAYTYCSRCEEILEGENTVIPAPGHLEAEKFEVEPTCTEPGHSGYVFCLLCGEILGGENVVYPPTGHTEVIVREVAPTCTEPGHTGYVYCSVCYEVLGGVDEEIPATGHTPVTVAEIAPTCTEGGHTGFTYCSVCEEIIEGTDEPISALGHQEAEVFEIAPTCTEPGHTGYVFCLRCNEILYGEDVEIPATGHTPVTVPGYPATCTEFGLTDGSKCSVCEATIVPGMLIPPTGHHYVDGVCEDCGDIFKSGWVVLDGNSYYYKKATGEMVTGFQYIGKILYKFGEDGVCEDTEGYTGYYKWSNGSAYFANGVQVAAPVLPIGWFETENGFVYASKSGELLTGFQYVKGILYKFDENGICEDVNGYTGYYKWSNGSANFENGVKVAAPAPVSGWNETEDGFIYVNKSGETLTGFQYVKGILYKFDENGICEDVNGYTGYYKWSNGSATFENGVIA